MFLKICKSTENYSFRLFYQINYRPTKTDKNSEELLTADRHVEKYKEVLEKICRKFVPNPTSNSTNVVNVDQEMRDKRSRKVHEYKLAQSMEESLKDLPDGLLRDVLENCGKFSLLFLCVCFLFCCFVAIDFIFVLWFICIFKLFIQKQSLFFSLFIAKLEKNIAVEIINNEIHVENEVTKKLATILENHIGRIQKQKRIVTKLMQDNESAKHKFQVKWMSERKNEQLVE